MSPAEEHRRVAAAFTERVHGTADWDAPTPVAGWAARDVVDHLVTWLPGFLEMHGIRDVGPGGHSAADDPVAAWLAHTDSVQALLDGPQAMREIDDERLGAATVGALVSRIYTTDVFLHTWDLARATGQDDTLDPETCAALLAGMEPMDEMLRASGQFGAKVDVPVGADVQSRLVAFIGRDPSWRPQ